jgi:hypothetical protein
VERSIDDAVAEHLRAELAACGLLLGAAEFAEAHARAMRRGAHLRAEVLRRCYPAVARGGATLAFDGAHTAARLDAALAFGAVCARVLAGSGAADAELVDVVCAAFNLGIGLVDGLCDDDTETGVAVLTLMPGPDLAAAVETPRARGWLRDRVPPAIQRNPTAVFTTDIVETFFETLHTLHPGDRWLSRRRRVGAHLTAALAAEHRSVVRPTDGDDLVECSRLTSVLPFRVIAAVAGGDDSAATLIGEAMWRVDDLVDLCQDARTGALNGLLPAAGLSHLRDGDIARAAAEAAANLRAGLSRQGDAPEDVALFRYFVQRYAGITT